MHLLKTKMCFARLKNVFLLCENPCFLKIDLIGFIINGIPKAGFGVGIWGTFSVIFFARFYHKRLF